VWLPLIALIIIPLPTPIQPRLEERTTNQMSDPPFTVKAVFEYTSDHDDDLHFQLNQVITVTAVEDADWYYGEYVDDSGSKQEGIFPRNFVERYEPTAPPRPSRPVKAKKEAEPAAPSQPIEPSAEAEPEPEPVEDKPSVAAREPQEQESLPPPAPLAELVPAPKQPGSPPAPAPAPAPASAKAPPPAVSTKPSSNAFKDRIAAFNKPAAPPIAPFKPGGTSSFIKKPFVAPPPSKNAYVPIPREQPPPKAYRREEEPEFANREPPVSEHSQPPPAEPSQDEDQPKPTSLKERIALLQKQQMEQASRMAEAAQKKEKAKKPPPKKRTDLQEAPVIPAESTELEQTEIVETPRNERPSLEGEGEEFKPPQLASPPQPSRELLSDTNDADYSGAADTEDAEETSTSREDIDERPQEQTPDSDNEEEEQEEEEEEQVQEEDEDVDPEVKRRMELRERMAKMSGGVGMMGMFGGGMPGMYGAKKAKPAEDAAKEEEPESVVPPQAPRIPIMALPGMNTRPEVSSPVKEVTKEDEHGNTPLTELHSPGEVPDIEDVTEEPAPRKSVDRARPPPPQERSVPPLPPVESRPPPPPVPVTQPPPPAPESRPGRAPLPMSPSSGSESDDEISLHTKTMSLNTAIEAPPAPPRRSMTYDSPRSPTISERRFSRGPPPIPNSPPHGLASSPQARPPQARPPPPPPPPPGALSRQGTSDTRHTLDDIRDEAEYETTEYEADYDTDIPPSAKFKDALNLHDRESSIDDGDEPQSPRVLPESRLPPLPPTAAPTVPAPAPAPRAIPPPPPSQPPNKRASMDVPRSAPPPPPPPTRDLTAEEENDEDDDEYDPYRYDSSSRPQLPPLPPPNAPPLQEYNNDDDDDDDDAVSQPHAPPPPPPERVVPPPSDVPRARQSVDISRSLGGARRSMDIPRPSLDMGFIATEVDLAENTFWWTQPSIPPPVFQNRKDLLFEIEESTSSRRGGKSTVNKDVYVLFADYSQTIINVRFDAKNPGDVSFEQRHEPPPSKLRQDQLEAAHERYGSRISAAASTIQNTTVGDGTPHGLVQHLLGPLGDVLLPVGTRAYGALVYANLANASVQQNDEIRAGDIISFRNARFQGHRGGLHQKYSSEAGKPDHVGVIVDWDGTKKKIHAWEQGRESKKVKPESFKLGDLKSGEVKVWRVMPRSWVGWE
jgi:myosin tail region-interacting protein MTI1